MNLTKLSIREPVFITMITFSILILGLFSYSKLGLALEPNVASPFVLVQITLEGASPEVINNQITIKVENAVSSVQGIKHIYSNSKQGLSSVFIEFHIETDPLVDAQRVRDKISGISETIPQDAKKPIIEQINFNAASVISVVVTADMETKELTEFIQNYIQKDLASLEGVGQVNLVGGEQRQIRVECDAIKLDSHNLGIEEVFTALNKGNVQIAAGNLDTGPTTTLITTNAKFKKVEDFSSLVVKSDSSRIIYLSDVAEVVNGSKRKVDACRINGKEAIGLNIIKQTKANTVAVCKLVRERCKELETIYHNKFIITPVIDYSIIIKDEDKAVLFDIFFGIFLTILIVWFFIPDTKSTLISAISLVTSIISGFVCMELLSYTLNYMTLLALSLSVGLLIDDAIVIIENINRHLEQSEDKTKSIIHATTEISLAIIATTMAMVAVFGPVAFMSGYVGQYFKEFGIIVTFSVLVSLFIAFTLTPMLSSQWLSRRSKIKKNYIKNIFESGIAKSCEVYSDSLKWFLQHRYLLFPIILAIAVGTVLAYEALGSEFLPPTDTNEFIVKVELDAGISIFGSIEVSKELEKQLMSNPLVTKVYTVIGGGSSGVNEVQLYVTLVKKENRKIGIEEVKNNFRETFIEYPDYKFSFVGSEGSNEESKPININIQGPNVDTLLSIAMQYEKAFQQISGLVDIDKNMHNALPENKMIINRDMASLYGFSAQQIATTLRTIVNGNIATYFDIFNDRLEVLVQMKKGDSDTMNKILSAKMNSTLNDSDNTLIPLSQFVSFEPIVQVNKLFRYDRNNQVKISANLYKKYLGAAMTEIREKTKDIKLPEGYFTSLGGTVQIQKEANAAILAAVSFSIFFVYMVLASLFRSYTQPFIIMLSFPLSLLGVFLGLMAFGSSISLMAIIGLVMLLGLVTKNSILLINYTNLMRKQNHSVMESIILAGTIRYKPIIMTSFAMVFGMLPIALSTGIGSSSRAPMGQAVMGGIITSTIFTLYLIPVVYSLSSDFSWTKLMSFFRKKKR